MFRGYFSAEQFVCLYFSVLFCIWVAVNNYKHDRRQDAKCSVVISALSKLRQDMCYHIQQNPLGPASSAQRSVRAQHAMEFVFKSFDLYISKGKHTAT